MKEIGIYIHIPFCIRKCDYCDFISYSDKIYSIKKYVDKIKEDIRLELNGKQYSIKTIYIGGGTPSCIDSKYIIEILDCIKQNAYKYNPIEITIEINPGTVTEGKIIDYKSAGINRISIGLQETNNNILKEIGRIHTYEQFLTSFNIARKNEIKNINVDLMIGLPNQRINNVKKSLECLLELKPEHISVYSLILENGTKLYKKYENKELNLPDEELERQMYWYVKNTLENNGYIHYEISNFSKIGYESKHNMDCWNQKEYIGFGLSAHSYINKIRYSNELNGNEIYEYLKCIHEKQTDIEIKKEFMLLGLRKVNGVNIQDFKAKFGENPIFLYKEELNKLVNKKLIEINGDSIKLTNKGLDLANLVWQEFV